MAREDRDGITNKLPKLPQKKKKNRQKIKQILRDMDFEDEDELYEDEFLKKNSNPGVK